MMLVEETVPPAGALPVQAFRDHLRMGSGFAVPEDAAETAALTGYLRAAISTIEARTGKVLLTRRYRLELEDWRDDQAQPLPLAPVSALAEIRITDGQGAVHEIAETLYRLVPDVQRPWISPRTGFLPQIPDGGFATLRFTAGFGESWDSVPADLAQAVLLLAARYYEDRSFEAPVLALPEGVSALIERWRAVRVLGGSGARRARALRGPA